MPQTLEKEIESSVTDLINQKNLLTAQKEKAIAGGDIAEVERLQEQIDIIDEQIQHPDE